MKTLLVFAIPIVLTNLLQQFYSMFDLMIAGQFIGNIGTVGVNTGGEIVDLVTPIAMGFSTAGQIFIAQLVGRRDETRTKKTIGTLFSFMMIVSISLGALTIVFSKSLLGILNCPEEAFGQARSYMIITALGMPFIFGYNAVVGILRGMGESRRPLIFILVATIINVVLDLVLVVFFRLEAAGTAIATVLSQFGSFIASLVFLSRRKEKFGFSISRSFFSLDKEVLWVLVKLGIPQVVRSSLVRLSMLWCNATANSYGMVVSATNSIGNKLQKFLEVFVQGVDTASASMVGQNLGARKTDRAGKVTLYTLAATLTCAAIVSCLCIFIPKQLFSVFSTDAAVKDLGSVYLRIMIVHFIVSATIGAYQAMVTGSGFVSLGFAIGIIDGVVCKIGLSYLLIYVFNLGYIGLFWGIACSRIIPCIICMVYYYSGKWRTRKLLVD